MAVAFFLFLYAKEKSRKHFSNSIDAVSLLMYTTGADTASVIIVDCERQLAELREKYGLHTTAERFCSVDSPHSDERFLGHYDGGDLNE